MMKTVQTGFLEVERDTMLTNQPSRTAVRFSMRFIRLLSAALLAFLCAIGPGLSPAAQAEGTVYTVAENETAPRPDPSLFGETTDPAVIQSLIDRSAPLLEGQDLSWNADIERMENTTMRYYCDDSILVITWKEAINGSAVTFAEIKIADGSQLRRALAGGRYNAGIRQKATVMGEESNAVVAFSGDFYDIRTLGITVYQRQLYRNEPSRVDTAYFTAGGDMIFSHRGELTGEGEAQAFIDQNDVIFSVAFGPILVEDGVLRTETERYPVGEINAQYSRAVIAQKDHLHYLLMTTGQEGPYWKRITVNEAGQLIFEKGVQKAYTLDGGQTATIAMQGSTVNRVDWDKERTMSDIIYFVSAIPESNT